MVLQTSGPISLDDIAIEFGDARPNSINEFYGAAAGIPTTGPISFDDFYGASSYTYPFNLQHSYISRISDTDDPFNYMPAGGYPSNFQDGDVFNATFYKNSSETIFIMGSMSANVNLAGGELSSINARHGGLNDTFDVNISSTTNPYDIGQIRSTIGYSGKPFINFIGTVNQYNSLYPNGFFANSGYIDFTYYTTFTNPIQSFQVRYLSWSDLYNFLTTSLEGPYPDDVPNPVITYEFDRSYPTNSFQAVLSNTNTLTQGSLVMVSVISQTNDSTQSLPQYATFEVSEGLEKADIGNYWFDTVTYSGSSIKQRTYVEAFIATKDIPDPYIICRPGGTSLADRKKIDALAVVYRF